MIVCSHRPPCPGCPRLGEPGPEPRALAALGALCASAGLAAPRVVRGPVRGFRHRARLAVRGRAAAPKIGIFETGTHRIVDIPRCLVHHPRINEVAGALRRAMVKARATPYSDEAQKGLVRYVQAVVAREGGGAQVVVVANTTARADVEPLLGALTTELGDAAHGLFWNENVERTNTILGPTFHHVSGPAEIVESIGGARVFYPPGAFGQSHLALADEIVRTVHAAVPDGARVLELYAGVGPIGLGLAARTSEVAMNELAEASLHGLALGVAALPEPSRARVRVVPGSAGDAAPLVATADVVIADPPRKGLDPAVRDALCLHPPSRFVYVACGLPAFLDDARALLEAGHLRLEDAVAFDLFPYTEHVEIVARFGRTT